MSFVFAQPVTAETLPVDLDAVGILIRQMHAAQTKQQYMIAIKASFVVRLNVC